MKRVKESGAAFRKKKKAREELAKKDEGALFKYFGQKELNDHGAGKGVPPDCQPGTSKEIETLASPTTRDHQDEHVEVLHSSSASGTSNVMEALANPGTGDEHARVLDYKTGAPVDTERENFVSSGTVTEDLKDVGRWPSKITRELRLVLVKQGVSAVQHLDADFGETVREGAGVKGNSRRLTNDWFYVTLPNGEKCLRSWMVYSPSKASIYCFCCRIFSDTVKSHFESPHGFNTWWKLNPKVSEHESSAVHQKNYTQWKELEIRIACGKTIDQVEQQVVEKEIKKWKEILFRLLDIITFLAKQNLSFRGHHEEIRTGANAESESIPNKGNFLELVHLLAKYDPVLREHLLRVKLGSKHSISYFSPTIQNEFIDILGQSVRKKIISRVKEAKYFAMIFDSTPDISHKDQVSQVLRYVSIEGDKVRVEESFLDFVETKGKIAESTANMILSKLESDGLDIKNCRGQAYDNAAVMAGQHSGVQKRIKEINQKAEFVACTNHSLNLVGVHAASVAIDSVTFFGTLDCLFAFFSASTHRWDVLISLTGQRLKRIVETRWSARSDAVTVVKNNFPKLLTTLEQLTGEEENTITRSDAAVLLSALQSFSFVCFLGLWGAILPEVNDAQAYLQTKGLNIQQCDVRLRALQSFLVDNRDELINEAFKYAKDTCEDLEIPMDRPKRKKKRKQMFDETGTANDADLSHEAELRREIFSSLDRVIKEISSRFQQLHDIAEKYQFLIPANLFEKEYVCQLDDFEDDIDKEQFLSERKRLTHFASVAGEDNCCEQLWKQGPFELLMFIHKFKLESSVPNIVILLRIFLTVAVSVATCERSFSKLKLIKNYLRSTMSNLRLRNLVILSIEHQLTEGLDFDELLQEFALKKARKISF